MRCETELRERVEQRDSEFAGGVELEQERGDDGRLVRVRYDVGQRDEQLALGKVGHERDQFAELARQRVAVDLRVEPAQLAQQQARHVALEVALELVLVADVRRQSLEQQLHDARLQRRDRQQQANNALRARRAGSPARVRVRA